MKTDELSGHVVYKAGEYEKCIRRVVGKTHDNMQTEVLRRVRNRNVAINLRVIGCEG
jgi:hypothetical protein